ncbi:MAG: bifunctional demethylmenaquinone methyltransferase/2-methoxy-6-polyprenyl-1,4-benzoquinol methylase UbiE [Pedosphaera sp.]|nr:bifunctional demethylmenaquinone methyltransferase/2-methoxy-6-polyprenyl-1,4-benzoquinol methylase UbiE [Pedosphaera sp.]
MLRSAVMANKFYVPGQQRADKVHDLFAAVAPRYDLINDLQSFGLHRVWKRRLVHMARVRPGDAALDLCCGTGDIAFALGARGANVVGLDFSAAMLEGAQKRSESNARVTFLRGDALQLPFPDNQFDIVTIGYGLRNLANFETALSEMLRVLKPGGRLLILDFGKPDNRLWRQCYFTYLRWIVPVFGRLFCGDSATHAYILESLKHYPAQNGIAALMAEMNCEEVKILNLLGGLMSINHGVKGTEA